MDFDPRRGFKLIDLMVAIFVIAILLGILAVNANRPRDDGRRVQCQNNMRQVALALLNFSTSKNHFPNAGTIYDDPAVHQSDPTKSNIYRSISDPATVPNKVLLFNWVVEILPYLDQFDQEDSPWDWDPEASYLCKTSSFSGQPSNSALGSTPLGVLRCPNDPTANVGQGDLSYVVNGGFMRWPAAPIGWSGGRVDGQPSNGGRLEWVAPGGTWQESQAIGKQLGVMFLGTQSGDQPWDIKTSPSDITDGSSNTLLVAENTLAGYSTGTSYSGGRPTNWACPLANFTMFLASDDVCRSGRSTVDCLGGQLQPRSKTTDGKGWALANSTGTYENINYGFTLKTEGSFPFANGNHGGGANFAFCDGAVRYMRETIDGTVYAKIITPAGNRLPEAIRQTPVDQGAFAN